MGLGAIRLEASLCRGQVEEDHSGHALTLHGLLVCLKRGGTNNVQTKLYTAQALKQSLPGATQGLDARGQEPEARIAVANGQARCHHPLQRCVSVDLPLLSNAAVGGQGQTVERRPCWVPMPNPNANPALPRLSTAATTSSPAVWAVRRAAQAW